MFRISNLLLKRSTFAVVLVVVLGPLSRNSTHTRALLNSCLPRSVLRRGILRMQLRIGRGMRKLLQFSRGMLKMLPRLARSGYRHPCLSCCDTHLLRARRQPSRWPARMRLSSRHSYASILH